MRNWYESSRLGYILGISSLKISVSCFLLDVTKLPINSIEAIHQQTLKRIISRASSFF